MIEGFIHAVSVCGPGLDGWSRSRPILAGLEEYAWRETLPAMPSILPANERRRVGAAVRLALTVAQQAHEIAGLAPGSIGSVFATSNGDGAVMHAVLQTLAEGQPVSPTQFHNSVHNAAAGYWSIATGSHEPASCLAGHDATPAAALLKVLAAVRATQQTQLLCVYETPMPSPLDARRPTSGAFGVGLVLAPRAGETALASLSVAYQPGVAAERDTTNLTALRALARGNPAARLLPLLEALARNVPATFSLALLESSVRVTVQPWSPASASSS
ncbi:MAG TPA: beta-ketoacyl synthase chain length factor [Acetobacteraceae bacterium]